MRCFSYDELADKGLAIKYSLTTSRMNGGREMEDELELVRSGIKIKGYPARIFDECGLTWWQLRDLYVPYEDRL